MAKLRELLHAINIIGEDRDVDVDGLGGICVCPPVKLTAAGRDYFREGLSANTDGLLVCDKDHRRNECAWELLKSCAGYCSTKDFERWFEGEDAKPI